MEAGEEASKGASTEEILGYAYEYKSDRQTRDADLESTIWPQRGQRTPYASSSLPPALSPPATGPALPLPDPPSALWGVTRQGVVLTYLVNPTLPFTLSFLVDSQ